VGKRTKNQGNVYQRANGTWEARVTYVDPGTRQLRRQSFYAPTAKAALAQMKKPRDRLDAGAPVKNATRTVGHRQETCAAAHVGRVGGLAVAFGVGAAVVTGFGSGVASADTPESTSSTSPDSPSSSSPDSPSRSATSSDSTSPSKGAATSGTRAMSDSSASQTSTASESTKKSTKSPTSQVRSRSASATPSASYPAKRSAEAGAAVGTGGRHTSSPTSSTTGSSPSAGTAATTAGDGSEPNPTAATASASTTATPETSSAPAPETLGGTAESSGESAITAESAPTQPTTASAASGSTAAKTTSTSAAVKAPADDSPAPTSSIDATRVVADAVQTPAATTPIVSAAASTPVKTAATMHSAADVSVSLRPTAAMSTTTTVTEPADILVGMVSSFVNRVLSPLAATEVPGAPAQPLTLETLLAFARREFERAFSVPSPAANPVATPITSAVVTDTPTLAGPSIDPAITGETAAPTEDVGVLIPNTQPSATPSPTVDPVATPIPNGVDPDTPTPTGQSIDPAITDETAAPTEDAAVLISNTQPSATSAAGEPLNRPTNSAVIMYAEGEPSASDVANWSKPGALVVVGRTNYDDPWVHTVADGGATVLLYLNTVNNDDWGRYHDKLVNASEFGPAVPTWPGQGAANEWGSLNDFREGSVLQDKLPGVIELAISENPHISGLFLDDLGSRSWYPGIDWDSWSDADKEAYRNGAIAITQTARAAADEHDLFLMVNGTWGATSLTGQGDGGYPNRSLPGNSLVDGGFVENHDANTEMAYWTVYAGPDAQWGNDTPRGLPYMWFSNVGSTADRDAWVAAGLAAFASSSGYGDGLVAPSGTFADFNLPNRAATLAT
jgi:hypothetical protein